MIATQQTAESLCKVRMSEYLFVYVRNKHMYITNGVFENLISRLGFFKEKNLTFH